MKQQAEADEEIRAPADEKEASRGDHTPQQHAHQSAAVTE